MNRLSAGARVALAALLLPMASPAAAGQSAPDTDAQRPTLDPVHVTSPLKAPGQVTLQTDDLPSGRESGELLRDIIGVSGSRMGGHGTDPVIRGLGQTRINVLLEGAFVHGACPNRMDPPSAYASAGGYDSITVMRGVTTLEYGSGPGGTVLFERDTPRFAHGEGSRGRIQSGLRSNGSAGNAGFDLAAGRPGGFLRGFASMQQAGDYRDGDGRRVRSGWKERAGGLVLGFTPGDEARLELGVEANRLRDELFAGAGMDSPVSDNDMYRVAWRSGALGPFSSLRAEASASRVVHVMDNYTLRPTASPTMRMRAPATSDTDSGRVVAETAQPDGTWRLGLTLQDNRRNAIRVNDANGVRQSILWPDVRIGQAGVFVERQQLLAGDRRLVSGLRYDHVRARAELAGERPAGTLPSPGQLYDLYNDDADVRPRSEANWSGLLRFEQDLSASGGTVYAVVSRTVRTADATERYFASNAELPSGRWVGNPGIRPERHLQSELGVVARRDAWSLEASAFHNRVADYILRDRFQQPGDNATVYRNTQAALWGGELTLGYRATGWHAEAGVAYVRGRDRNRDIPLAQMPPLEASLDLGWHGEQWQAGTRVRAAARQGRIDADPMSGSGLDVRATPGWAVLDLYARYEVGVRWTLEAGVDNVFDRLYAEHLNRSSAFDATQIQVNEPGRSAWMKLATRF